MQYTLFPQGLSTSDGAELNVEATHLLFTKVGEGYGQCESQHMVFNVVLGIFMLDHLYFENCSCTEQGAFHNVTFLGLLHLFQVSTILVTTHILLTKQILSKR